MTITRIYQAIPIKIAATVTLDERASHHVSRVLRARQGDKLIIFNGQGGEYVGEINSIGKKSVDVAIETFNAKEVESPLQIELAQGVARGEKMDFIVQKAVELGVSNISPLITERCNVRLEQVREEKRTMHWQAVAVSACEQSGRNRVPPVSASVNLLTWLSTVRADFRFLLSPGASTTLKAVSIPTKASVALLIGPEGGLSAREEEEAQYYGFQPLCLGPRILRTETATLAALTVVQSLYGDLT